MKTFRLIAFILAATALALTSCKKDSGTDDKLSGPSYAITLASNVGVAKATVNGQTVTQARKGATVTITVEQIPASWGLTDWTVISGEVTLADASKVTTTFTMTDSDVSLKATLSNQANYDILLNYNMDLGVVRPMIGDQSAREVKEGDVITLYAFPEIDAAVDKWEVLQGGITLEPVADKDDAFTFTMPARDVEIDITFGYATTIAIEGTAAESVEVTLARSADNGEDLVVDARKLTGQNYLVVSGEGYLLLKDCTLGFTGGATTKVNLGRAPKGTIALFVKPDKTLGLQATAGVYRVNTLDELNLVRTNMTGSYLQTCDLDFMGNDALRPAGASVGNWLPIGAYEYNDTGKTFKGIYDGGGHTISNLNIVRNASESSSGVGLFGCSRGTLKNIKVANGVVDGSFAGAICGINLEPDAKIENCTNLSVSIRPSRSSTYNIGGICGVNDQGTIADCKNECDFSVESYNVGGICGNNGGIVRLGREFPTTIRNCVNSGNVASTLSGISGESNVGGIAGKTSIGWVLDCSNSGNISGKLGNVGGVCGYYSDGWTVENCSNSGSVTSTYVSTTGQGLPYSSHQTYVGGIVGYLLGSPTVKGCINSGNVLAAGVAVGGICGGINTLPRAHATITQCKNSGNVETTYTAAKVTYVGGICGYQFYAWLSACHNTGDVSSPGGYVGGISGYIHTDDYAVDPIMLDCCANSGTVTASGSYVGGFTGSIDAPGIIRACWNQGDVYGQTYVGGFVGETGSITYQSCYVSSTAFASSGSDYARQLAFVKTTAASCMMYNCYSPSAIVSGGATIPLSGGSKGGQLYNTYAFTSTQWPSASDPWWGLYTNQANLANGYCWKSLGKWTMFYSDRVYPSLWWE